MFQLFPSMNSNKSSSTCSLPPNPRSRKMVSTLRGCGHSGFKSKEPKKKRRSTSASSKRRKSAALSTLRRKSISKSSRMIRSVRPMRKSSTRVLSTPSLYFSVRTLKSKMLLSEVEKINEQLALVNLSKKDMEKNCEEERQKELEL